MVNALDIFAQGSKEHTKRIAAQGYGASYTMPMYSNGEFFGFVFFNSYRKNVFDEKTLHFLHVAWSIDDAFKELRKLAGPKLDSDCVQALIENRPQLEEIKNQLKEDFYG